MDTFHFVPEHNKPATKMVEFPSNVEHHLITNLVPSAVIARALEVGLVWGRAVQGLGSQVMKKRLANPRWTVPGQHKWALRVRVL